VADGRDQDPGSSTPEGDDPEVDSTSDAVEPETADSDGEARGEPDDIDLSEYEAEFGGPAADDDAADATGDEAGDDPAGDDLAGDDDADGNGELVAVGSAAASPAKRGAAGKDAHKKDAHKDAEKKGRPTPKRASTGAEHHRTGPVTFVKESVAELRKVVYPTGQQLINYFVVVLIFVLFIIAIVSLLALAFGWLIFKVFA
jgi:preprotein translocase subunit SecE